MSMSKMFEEAMEGRPLPVAHTLNPACTGTSVLALTYDGGVALLADRVVSYGKTARYKGVTRVYRVSDDLLVAFSGDHADFQWLQNVIERQRQQFGYHSAPLTPHALHAFLGAVLYARRCKMNPLWNTLIVTGVQRDVDQPPRPFLGVVTQKGVAYTPTHTATGIGAMLLNQVVEDTVRQHGAGKLATKEEAIAALRKAAELAVYHDCTADNEFDLVTVDVVDGISAPRTETVTGDWSIAETNCQYE